MSGYSRTKMGWSRRSRRETQRARSFKNQKNRKTLENKGLNIFSSFSRMSGETHHEIENKPDEKDSCPQNGQWSTAS
jgi:hypothetical protein